MGLAGGVFEREVGGERRWGGYALRVVDQVTRWLRAAAQPAVVRRALLASIVVGSVLVLINHATALLASKAYFILQSMTYAVPYIVSTASSIAAARGQARLLETRA